MNIRFISTLTAEDENHLAPGILKAVCALAEMFPIRFAVRLDTVDGRTYLGGNHSPAPGAREPVDPVMPVMPPGSPIES